MEKSGEKWYKELYQPFVDLVHAPRALWGINLPYFLEGMCYFGWAALFAIYFNKYIGLNDQWADWMVGLLIAGVTFTQIFLGGRADKLGYRRAILIAFALVFVGRFIIAAVSSGEFPLGGGFGSVMFVGATIGIVFYMFAYGLYQPAAYAAVDAYCDEKTKAMGYAMLYALMNAGAAGAGLLSPLIRGQKGFLVPDGIGIVDVFWVYVALTVVSLLSTIFILTKGVEKRAIEQAKAAKALKEGSEGKKDDAVEEFTRHLSIGQKAKKWLHEHPLADAKFAFFIFAVMPVQTIFAHYYFTYPQYVSRALGPVGDQYMETLTNFINPVMIFILTPLVAAYTRKVNVFTMMILGTFVMSVPTFLLALHPSVVLFVLFVVITSVGEAMWQPRFLQYAAEIAPEGRKAAYMGVAQLPWFLTKFLTSLFAGWFLMRYCPEKGAQDTRTMWIIYGLIAVSSPFMLFFARNWIGKSINKNAADKAAVA